MRRSTARGWPLALILGLAAGPLVGGDWKHWRGPDGTGTSPERNLPTRWGSADNLAWTLALPSASGSTPIVTGDRVFLMVVEAEEVALWCVDRARGSVSWKRVLGSAQGETHRKHNMSTPSPVTDGRRVVAMTGNGVIGSFSLTGEAHWSRDIQADYGAFGLMWGYGASPLLVGDTLYVPVLHGMKTDDPSYLLGIDATSGKTRFRVERPTTAILESPDAYSSPVLARKQGASEIVVTGGDVVTGHDPATGAELWRAGGLNPGGEGNYRIVASPVTVGDVVIAPTRIKPMLAVRAFGRGDVTESHRLWSFDRGPDVPTPAADARHLYVVTDKGILWCLDLETGEPVYGPERLAVGTYSSSPLLADGKLYVVNEEAVTSVIKAGPSFELLAENALEGYTISSPVAAGGQILLRTEQTLYCIGQGD